MIRKTYDIKYSLGNKELVTQVYGFNEVSIKLATNEIIANLSEELGLFDADMNDVLKEAIENILRKNIKIISITCTEIKELKDNVD